MPNLLQRAAVWLGEKLQDAGGRTVTYRRGDVFELPLTITPHMHREPVFNEGLPLAVRVYDWTLTASELVHNGEIIEPHKTDQIVETLPNGDEVTWQVMPPNDETPCFEWMDSSKLLLVVHTKQV